MTTEHKYEEKRSNNLILPIILGLLMLGAAFWAFSLRSKNAKLSSDKAVLSSEMDKLGAIKANLNASIDSLNASFQDLAEENTALTGSLESEKAKAKKANSRYHHWKKKWQEAQNSNSSMAEQIQSLLAAKSGMESTIVSLQTQNDSLMQLTATLKEDLSETREAKKALERMNESINGELKRLTLANFKATAFNVTTLTKRGKQQMRAWLVRQIKVSFDLANVPEKYRGVRPVYMVITDEKSVPIPMENAIDAKVKVNGQELDLKAVEVKEINIDDSQRLAFTHKLAKKLKKGYYRVAVYTDIGMLGASSFRLR